MTKISDLEFLRKLARMKILAVDDHRNMVKTLENMLVSICSFQRKSQSIFRANDGKEAIGIITGQVDTGEHIDLVLLDWNMPNVPGIEVIRAIRGSHLPYVRNIPVIMITGEAQAKDVKNAIYEGVDSYLLKPFVMEDLRTRMTPLLRHYWAGLPMKRAKNRRHEVRYDAERLKMQIEIELLEGSRQTARVLTLSEHGARIRAKVEATPQLSAIYFSEPGTTDGFVHKITPVAFPPDIRDTDNNVEMSLWFKYGFESEELGKKWKEWIMAARAKDMEYRGQQI